uniref:Phosphate transporter n=1 Tax=Blastobotrys adeninivorans TaxID=409370 RepID=A0A060TDG5_BLAAD
MPVLSRYDWIFALITIAFCASAFGNGANDVANSYATSVSARTLTLPQVGLIAMCTEFVGAIALGSHVTKTIKGGIISMDRFEGKPGVLMLAMACAEFGSATWLIIATRFGLPVSTTQTIVGALVGVGLASQAEISWEWKKGSVSQTAASWGIAPAISAGFAAVIFMILRLTVLDRKDPFKWALRLIPFYLSVTGAILALFIVIEAPTAPSLEEFGAGKACGIVFGVLVGCLLLSYVFFVPYIHRRVVKGDTRVKFYHLPLGPLLWKENPPIYFPSKSNSALIDYYENAHYEQEQTADQTHGSEVKSPAIVNPNSQSPDATPYITADRVNVEKDPEAIMDARLPGSAMDMPQQPKTRHIVTPRERFIEPVQHLPKFHPQRLWGYFKFGFLHGVTVDAISHSSERVRKAHAKAKHYDNRVEHLWTYAQVVSAMMMSIAHGSNDVANAVGPWAATYSTWQTSTVDSEADTPPWMLAVAGILLGTGFWFFGYHVVRSMGNRITQLSPTRGFSMELGAAITVMLASRLGLPVSTTQCVVGSLIGVAICNGTLAAVNWRQVVFIFSGWVFTLPSAGLIAGLLFLMAVNTPHF